jgi:CRP-like cAMP-binding protein
MGVDWLLIRGVADPDRERLFGQARRRAFRRNEVVFHEGDAADTLHFVETGHVAVRAATDMGDSVTFRILGPGDVFGELSLLTTPVRRYASVVALEPTVTHCIHRDHFEELRERDLSIDRVLIELLAGQVRRLSADLVEALFVSVDTRVLRRLLAMAELYGGAGPGTRVPLTQEELAHLAGTSRATASRVLRSAEKAGAIALRRAAILVHDPEWLRRAAAEPWPKGVELSRS